MARLYFVREKGKFFQYPHVKAKEKFIIRTAPHQYHASIVDIDDEHTRRDRFIFRKSNIGPDYDPSPFRYEEGEIEKGERVQTRFAFLVQEIVNDELRYLDIGSAAFHLTRKLFDLHDIGLQKMDLEVKRTICAGDLEDMGEGWPISLGFQPVEIISPTGAKPVDAPLKYIDEESGWFERYLSEMRERTEENAVDTLLLCRGDDEFGHRLPVGEEFVNTPDPRADQGSGSE